MQWDLLPIELSRDLIVSALGGLTVATATFSYRAWSKWRLQQKYSVSGDYIAFYDDLLDGKTVVIASRAKFTQSGAEVKIENSTQAGRSWTCEGTLLPGGHISGVYSADASYDDGVGSFYLRVNGRDLDGMWTGYDHQNRIVNSGKYWFRKIEKASVRLAKQSDVIEMLSISAEEFGSGYYSEADIKLELSNLIAVVGIARKEVVGFGVAQMATLQDLDRLMKGHVANVPSAIAEAAKVNQLGLIKTVAVKKAHQRRGIGTRILADLEQRLQAKGAQRTFVPAWKEADRVHIGGVLTQADFKPAFEIQDFWKSSCDDGEFKCVSRTDRCVCSAVFYQDT